MIMYFMPCAESIVFYLHIIVSSFISHAIILKARYLYNFGADFSCLATYDVQETTIEDHLCGFTRCRLAHVPLLILFKHESGYIFLDLK